MKKVNKILMATVAILLSLVLISTCLVSGTLAKFAIIKDATTEVSFKKFGVKLSVGREAQVIDGPDVNSVSITYDDFEMYPGVDKTPAIWFAFDNGKLSVDATVTIKVYVELSDKFIIPADDKDGNDILDFSGFTTSSKYKTGQTYMPLDFKIIEIDAKGSPFGSPYNYSASMYSYDNIDALENALEKGIAKQIYHIAGGAESTGSDTNGTYSYITKSFKKDNQIKFLNTSGIGIGFCWEEGSEYDSTKPDNIAQNALSTWIANQFTDPNEKPIKITLAISLEQKIETT